MKIILSEFENIKGNLKSDLPFMILHCKSVRQQKENALSVGKLMQQVMQLRV